MGRIRPHANDRPLTPDERQVLEYLRYNYPDKYRDFQDGKLSFATRELAHGAKAVSVYSRGKETGQPSLELTDRLRMRQNRSRSNDRGKDRGRDR
jgi:hypothetical protein